MHNAAIGKSAWQALRRLLQDAFGGLRLQLDFAKGGFVLGDVLLQNADQRLGLLRAHVDALEIADGDVLRAYHHALEGSPPYPLPADF